MGFTEAPHIYVYNDYFYLLTAEGGTEYDHCMTFARSKNLEGPYEVDPDGYFLTSKDDPSLPLQRSGHGDIVETPDGDIYVVHLSSRPSLESEEVQWAGKPLFRELYGIKMAG